MVVPQKTGKLEKIPFGRNSWHFQYLKAAITSVVSEIQSIPGAKEKILWVSCRLNTTKTRTPVFSMWVESHLAITTRVNKGIGTAPIDIRHGDTHLSTLYRDCLAAGPGQVVPRDWSKQVADSTSQEIGRNFYEETHRRSVAIQIDGKTVGSLNAGFKGDPASEDSEIRDVLVKWAQHTNSDLVQFIRDHLDYR
jgi:hypothetical protein